MQHAELEEVISQEGTELLRGLLQGHLDLRSAGEPRVEQITGVDGVVRDQCRAHCERQLMRLFGEVRLKRMGYRARGAESIFPLDAALSLPTDKYSDGLPQRVAEEVAKGSFDAAVASVEQTTGGKVPKRQAEEIALEVSEDFCACYEQRQAEGPEATADPLILSQDGKGILMRMEDLREATRKAAQSTRHKLKSPVGRREA